MGAVAARLESLDAVNAAVTRELGAATHHKGHPWRVAVLATTDGDVADARSVVLREWDEPRRTLLIYTDARSAKVAQFTAHPMGTLVLWSEALGWQLRLRVKLELQTAGLAVSSRWARLKMTPAAHDYLSPLPPGSTLDAPHHLPPTPTRESRDNFAVVMARVQAMDWLELHAEGHRRARFDGRGARWLAP
ncbi:MAG: pyridoxamine 5'-phosphate oxidase [Leptothrix sp. (in: Bacteria)]|nr:pyridoxamine 5'-phosphate oxidase [Leptothrix sp. (in: b-proteobacteria)]